MILQTLDHLLTTGSAISSALRILNSFIFKKASNYSVKLHYIMVLSLINFHNLQLFHCQLLVLICIDKIFCPKPANNFSLQIELQGVS